MVQQADNTQGMPGPGPGPGGEWFLENSGGTGDLAKWLHTGFTPRAGGDTPGSMLCCAVLVMGGADVSELSANNKLMPLYMYFSPDLW